MREPGAAKVGFRGHIGRNPSIVRGPALAALHSVPLARIITTMATSVRRRTRGLFRGSRSGPAGPEVTIQGSARLGRKTKVARQPPGCGGHRDHRPRRPRPDRRRGARGHAGFAAVVNVAPSSTGRYPNAGPLLLAQAGVRLIDAPAAPLFEELRDGDPVAIAGGEIRCNGAVLAAGRVLDVAELAEQLAEQRERIDEALAEFAENTMTHLREEGELLAGGFELPRTRTSFRDRHVLIVVRGTHLPQGPAGAARLHPRRAAAAGRRRRRRRRAARGGAASRTWSSATWTRPATRRCAAAPS